MQEEEEKIDPATQAFRIEAMQRDNVLLISSIASEVQVHLQNNQQNTLHNSEVSWGQQHDIDELIQNNFIDISALTKSKSLDDIKKILFDELISESRLVNVQQNISSEDPLSLSNTYTDGRQEQNIEDSFMHRSKKQKLTSEQLKYLKLKIEISGLPQSQLWRKYLKLLFSFCFLRQIMV